MCEVKGKEQMGLARWGQQILTELCLRVWHYYTWGSNLEKRCQNKIFISDFGKSTLPCTNILWIRS